MSSEKKIIWRFGMDKTEGGKELAHILGNKGAQLCEMAKIGIPVPPGFIISTQACSEYMRQGEKYMKKLKPYVEEELSKLKNYISKIRKDKDFPLLLSVRSGAVVSMPGMMDTILNVGMTKSALEYLKKIDERFAYDTWRRFIQMFSSIALGVPKNIFEEEFERWKKAYEIYLNEGGFSDIEHAYNNLGNKFERSKLRDIDLPASVMKKISERFLDILKERGIDFPEDPLEQVMISIEAVFRSWNSERAIAYRRIHNISDDLGTAVNIVAMVFGNMGDDSGTGVLFTRNPNTGEKYLWGNFLPNAQGEDVVAGIRTPYAINEESKSSANKNFPTLKELMPDVYKELQKVSEKLESHYKEMQDIEFTIERRKLWILQTRTGKRTARAHLKITYDMIKEKKISEKEGIKRITPKHLSELLFPVVDEEKLKSEPIAKGIAASPGAVYGKVVFSPKEVEEMVRAGERVILVRHETSPEDIKGIAFAVGILTSRGGETSHAAVVARAMGKPAVVGAEDIFIDYENNLFKVKDIEVKKGDLITIDGNTGRVFLGSVPVKEADFPEEAVKILEIADKIRRLGVRANADTPEDARVARKFGAEGIGLLRTEHMFFKEERIPLVRKMIILARKYKQKFDEMRNIIQCLSEDGSPEMKKLLSGINMLRYFPKFQRGKSHEVVFREIEEKSKEDERLAKSFSEYTDVRKGFFNTLSKIKEWIKKDFKEIFSVMEGLPVTVRLIDPPLHEFLPKSPEEIKDTSEKSGIPESEIMEILEKLRETNPMLGHRGVRVGISYPEIYCMQVEAILEASSELIKSGKKVLPEIMLPNVIDPEEIKYFRNVIEMIQEDVEKEMKVKIPLSIGTMMEFPRACLLAGEIAKFVDFFSFGTNDLTQTTMGISRDDSGKFIDDYVPMILPYNPFSKLDVVGVGKIIKIALKEARDVKPRLKVGVCGEHGGDPDSISFFHSAGFDYISASPYRVSIARLSAAQAEIDVPSKKEKKDSYLHLKNKKSQREKRKGTKAVKNKKRVRKTSK
ncbi:Pyruvate, phosphate dikinase [bacterium HR19]|nr:Pyruvate, phosphate dikinase [bacterium HR19]